jgi:hypothetical protein
MNRDGAERQSDSVPRICGDISDAGGRQSTTT